MNIYNKLDTFYKYDIKYLKKIELQAYQLLRSIIEKINTSSSKPLIDKFQNIIKDQHFFNYLSIKCHIKEESCSENIEFISLNHFKKYLTIGRSKDSDIRLTNLKVSNQHAKVHIDNYLDLYIEDLGSVNGSFLNGTRILPNKIIRITHKDHIKIGDNAISFNVDFISAKSPDISFQNIQTSFSENDILYSSEYSYFFTVELPNIPVTAILEIDYNFISQIINRIIGIQGHSELIPELPGNLEKNIVVYFFHRFIAEFNKDPLFNSWGPFRLVQMINPIEESNNPTHYRSKKYFRIMVPLAFDGLNTMINIWIPSSDSIHIVEKMRSIPKSVMHVIGYIKNDHLFESIAIDVSFRLTTIVMNYTSIRKLEKSYLILPKSNEWNLDCNNDFTGQIHMAINPDKFCGGVLCTCTSMGNMYKVTVQKIEKGDWERMKEYNHTQKAQDLSNESTCSLENSNQQIISAIELQITIELGRIRMPLMQILALKQGDIFTLNKRLDDSLDLYIGQNKLGYGKLVRIEDSLGIEILSMCEIKK